MASISSTRATARAASTRPGMLPRLRHIPLVLMAGACGAMPVLAQQTDAGNLLREAERARPGLSSEPALPSAPAAAPAADGQQPRVAVKGFVITGATLVPQEELQAALASYRDRALGFRELQQAADAVAAAYRQRGYLVRALLPEQDLASGMVRIAVIEGRLSDLRIDRAGESGRLTESTVRAHMLARQRAGEPLRTDALERGIGLLNDLPGVSADLLLEPGAREGESRAVVRVRDESLVSGQVQLDNSGVRSTGSGRLLASVSLDNPWGLGDQFTATALNTRDSHYVRLGASVPLGGDGWRVGAAVSALRYDYQALGATFSGSARIATLSATYPLLRAREHNLRLGITVDDKRFDNAVAGFEINDKRSQLLTVSLGGDRRDNWGGAGLWVGSIGVSGGSLDLAGNAADLAADQVGARRDGHFHKLNWNLARLQQIGPRDTAWLSLSGQSAGGNLDSSEKFSLAGPSAVRAYPSGEASGDDGWLLTAEWRRRIDDTLQLSAFVDRGGVQRDHRRFAGSQNPNTVHLAGAGVAANWTPRKGLTVNTGLAWRIGSNPLRDANGRDSDGTRRDPRLWITLNQSF